MFPTSASTRVYQVAQIRALEQQLLAQSTTPAALMQAAARACLAVLQKRWPLQRTITVMAGTGNNAGDGYWLAVYAKEAGWNVRIFTSDMDRTLSEPIKEAVNAASQLGINRQRWTPASELRGVVVDALLGIGLRGALSASVLNMIEAINRSDLPVLSIDVPSGLCADRGAISEASVQADVTVTFIGHKLGLLTGAGPVKAGTVYLDDLGCEDLIEDLPQTASLLQAHNLPSLPPRNLSSHKGQYGHCLVMGGDHGYGGAAILASQAALRGGAGRVTLVTRTEHVAPLLARQPEVMALGVDSSYRLPPLLEQADALVLGPGLGQAPWGSTLLSLAQTQSMPQVWDADALNLLAAGEHQISPNAPVILTPHPGEAARLLGLSVSAVEQNRYEAAQNIAKRWNAVVVLKGRGSLIVAPDGRLAICGEGHPAMASAGLGDVLAGWLGALLCQGLSTWDAARLGVWLHARAGVIEGQKGRGLAAADLIPSMRALLEEHSPCLN